MLGQRIPQGLPVEPTVHECKEAALMHDFTLVLSQESLKVCWLNGVLSSQIDITCVKDERSHC